MIPDEQKQNFQENFVFARLFGGSVWWLFCLMIPDEQKQNFQENFVFARLFGGSVWWVWVASLH